MLISENANNDVLLKLGWAGTQAEFSVKGLHRVHSDNFRFIHF